MTEGLELEFNERNKRIGILIAVLAGVLAFTEAGGQNASSDALRGTIEASNTWAFFQAKTIRMTTLRTQARDLELSVMGMEPGAKLDEINKTIAEWRATADRYDSEPETGEGRKELTARAKTIEAARDEAAAANGSYDLGKFGVAARDFARLRGRRDVGVVACLYRRGARRVGRDLRRAGVCGRRLCWVDSWISRSPE